MNELTWYGCHNILNDPIILDWWSNTWWRKCLFDEDKFQMNKENQVGDKTSQTTKNTLKNYKWYFCENPLSKEDVDGLPENVILKSLLNQKVSGIFNLSQFFQNHSTNLL